MFLLKKQAKKDLKEILEYVASYDNNASYEIENFITKTCKLLNRNKQLGIAMHHPTMKDIRYLTVTKYSNYIIFYQIKNNNIEVLRISHRARNWIKLLLE